MNRDIMQRGRGGGMRGGRIGGGSSALLAKVNSQLRGERVSKQEPDDDGLGVSCILQKYFSL